MAALREKHLNVINYCSPHHEKPENSSIPGPSMITQKPKASPRIFTYKRKADEERIDPPLKRLKYVGSKPLKSISSSTSSDVNMSIEDSTNDDGVQNMVSDYIKRAKDLAKISRLTSPNPGKDGIPPIIDPSESVISCNGKALEVAHPDSDLAPNDSSSYLVDIYIHEDDLVLSDDENRNEPDFGDEYVSEDDERYEYNDYPDEDNDPFVSSADEESSNESDSGESDDNLEKLRKRLGRQRFFDEDSDYDVEAYDDEAENSNTIYNKYLSPKTENSDSDEYAAYGDDCDDGQ